MSAMPARLRVVAVGAFLLASAACGGTEPTRESDAALPPASPAASTESLVRALEVAPPGDTLFGPGDGVQLTVAALDASGTRVDGAVARWTVSDTTLATVSEAGVLRVRGSGRVTVTAIVGAVEQAVTLPMVNVDLETARDVLTDPYVVRLLSGLEGPPGDVARVTLAEASGALASGNVAVLRRGASRVRQALADVAATPDRALVAVLDLYVDRLARALQLTSAEEPIR